MSEGAEESVRPIPGFLGYYDVSESGVVRSLVRAYRGEPRPRKEPFVMRQLYEQGYWKVTLSVPGKRSNDPGGRYKVGIHRLVALAFLDPFPEEEWVVAHLDGDSSHNHWRNLEWATQYDNVQMKEEHGTMLRGDSHPRSTSFEDCLAYFRLVAAGQSRTEAALEVGLSPRSASNLFRLTTENARAAATALWMESEDWLLLIGLFPERLPRR